MVEFMVTVANYRCSLEAALLRTTEDRREGATTEQKLGYQHTELLGLAVSLENPEGCQSCYNFLINRKLLAPVHSSMCNRPPPERGRSWSGGCKLGHVGNGNGSLDENFALWMLTPPTSPSCDRHSNVQL